MFKGKIHELQKSMPSVQYVGVREQKISETSSDSMNKQSVCELKEPLRSREKVAI